MNEVNEFNETQENPQQKCNCEDTFALTPCPVHSVNQSSDTEPFGGEVMVITDTDLAPEIYGTYEGFKFTCRYCNLPSIIVNQDIHHRCVICGRKVVVRSKTVTEHIRKVQRGK